MDLPSVKKHLHQFQDQNIIALATPTTQPVVIINHDTDVWKNNSFDFSSIAMMSIESIISLIKTFYEHFNIQYDIVTVNTTAPTQHIIDMYEAYHNQMTTTHRDTNTVTPTKDHHDSDNENTTSPNQSTSSKKRRVTQVPKDDAHMENRDYPTIDPHTNVSLSNDVQDIFTFKMNDVKKMDKKTVTKYLKAYAMQYNLHTSPTYYQTSSLSEMREQLIQATVELYAFCTPRSVNSNSTDHEIKQMEPILVYKELFQFELQNNPSYDIGNILI